MKNLTAQSQSNNKGHSITGNVLRNSNDIAVHGRSASKMTTSQTNDMFKQLAKAQRAGK